MREVEAEINGVATTVLVDDADEQGTEKVPGRVLDEKAKKPPNKARTVEPADTVSTK